MDIVELQRWGFIPHLPPDIGAIRDLLQDYSKLPAEDINRHLVGIREKAWTISNAPFIGRWKFLNLIDPTDERYQQVLFRLKLPKSKDAVLDLGCGLGNFLRQLRADGVSGSQLFGTDVNSLFIDLGYALFRDKDAIGASFVTGDMVDPGDDKLYSLEGKVTMVHADSFFHLFDWTKQLFIGIRIVKFLKPGTVNALIFGRQAGIPDGEGVEAGEQASAATGNSCYVHNKASFQKLWNEIGSITNTRWAVELEPDGTEPDQLPGCVEGESKTIPVKFTVVQIPTA